MLVIPPSCVKGAGHGGAGGDRGGDKAEASCPSCLLYAPAHTWTIALCLRPSRRIPSRPTAARSRHSLSPASLHTRGAGAGSHKGGMQASGGALTLNYFRPPSPDVHLPPPFRPPPPSLQTSP